jgi:hypothetical protein
MMLAGGAVALGVGYDVACTPSSEANFCCNANGDPCCAVENCGAPMNPECQAERSCVADGGDYENGSCLYDAGDAAVTPPPFPCCNANGDPCCTFLHCDAGITPQCQAELACIDAGLWDAGALVCVAPTDDDASTEDAGADADASSDASAEGAADGASDVDAHD